jgi:archaeosine synthase beta-subunit
VSNPYPETAAGRTDWILSRRGPRRRVDPARAIGSVVERERTERGDVADVATIFLANRECPWRCLMCDLWTRTLETSVPPGAIPAQIDEALGVLPPVSRIKLYNAGSFFDRRAVPPEDHAAIAARLEGFERVVVESHPALVGEDCFRFAGLVSGALEVAMGLETAHAPTLERLNKGMTLDSFRAAAARLGERGISLRVFVLVGLPFLSPEESLEWCRESARFAFDCGATAVALIPTRSGNGAMDELARRGEFRPPTLSLLERAAARALGDFASRGRVFSDLWDLERLRGCATCFPARRRRLERMNLEQAAPPSVACDACGESPS